MRAIERNIPAQVASAVIVVEYVVNVVEMRSKEGAGFDLLAQGIDRRFCNASGIVRRCTSPELVQEDLQTVNVSLLIWDAAHLQAIYPLHSQGCKRHHPSPHGS